jgi:putative transposase
MPMGRPKAELLLSEDERSQLNSIARSRSISAALVTRARIVLAAAAGEPNSAIAQRLQLTRATVGKWRIRFLEHRINGLYDEVRPGKPRTIVDERLAQLIHKTLHTKPADGSTHWSVRTIAAETAISRRVCTVTSSCWACNRIAAKASNSRPISSSSRSCATWSACT